MATRLIQTGQEVQNILNNAIELFWAKYGETTYAEIDAAVASGALVACMHDSSAYFYSGIAGDNNTMVFSKFGASTTPPSVDTILLNIGNNQWSEGDNFPLENVGNKIKTTDSHPEYQLESDDKYLSSKSTSRFFNRRASALQLTGGHVMYIHLGSLVTTDLPFYRVWYGDGTGAPYGEIIIELQKRLVSWTPPDAAEYAYAIKAINIGTTDSVAVSFVQASGYYWLKISVPSEGTRNAPFYVTASDGSEARVSQSCGGTETEIVAATVVNFASSTELANYMPKSGGRFSGRVIFEDRASFEGPLSLDDVQIHGLADPTSLGDAANKQYVDSGLATKASASDVSDISAKIPAQASAQNQLADKNFVNSSIQTATATFKGNWETWDNVSTNRHDYPDEIAPDVNDYMVVRDASDYAPRWDSHGSYDIDDVVYVVVTGELYRCTSPIDYHDNPEAEPPENNPEHFELVESNPNYEGTWRFKYAGSWAVDNKWGWLPEYQVNEKPLTAEQLAALNSGIVSNDVTKLRALPTKPVDTQAQELTDSEKAQARENIEALSAGDIPWRMEIGLDEYSNYIAIQLTDGEGCILAVDSVGDNSFHGVLNISTVEDITAASFVGAGGIDTDENVEIGDDGDGNLCVVLKLTADQSVVITCLAGTAPVDANSVSTNPIESVTATLPWTELGAGGGNNVFIAMPEVTTFQEIKDAIDSGKAVFCWMSQNKETLLSLRYYGSTRITFEGYDDTNRFPYKTVNSNNQWTGYFYNPEYTSDKVSSIDSTNYNSYGKYPSLAALNASLYKWGVISQVQTWTTSAPYTYTMQDKVEGIIPQFFIDLVTCGLNSLVNFNSATGYFELNELTDISYQEMLVIYDKAIRTQDLTCLFKYGAIAAGTPRTTLPRLGGASGGDGGGTLNLAGTFLNSRVETIAFLQYPNATNYTMRVKSLGNTFKGAKYLKKIINIMRFDHDTPYMATDFAGCTSLEYAHIKTKNQSLVFSDSPYFALESVVWIVENAVNTSAITITLHADAYARCQADTTEYSYGGNTYTGIIAYANARNITIASA